MEQETGVYSMKVSLLKLRIEKWLSYFVKSAIHLPKPVHIFSTKPTVSILCFIYAPYWTWEVFIRYTAFPGFQKSVCATNRCNISPIPEVA